MIIALDLNHKITYINDAGCKILGLPQEKIIGLDWFDNFIPEEQREKLRKFSKKSYMQIGPVEYYENSIINAPAKKN
jgi:PAS domain S-box-containing protein